jgi:hypothetical protein
MAVRKLTADEVEFSLEIEDEDIPVEGHFATDEPEKDRALEKEILDRLRRGDLWAWCTVVVTARWKDWKGVNSLGGCSYESEADFRKDDGYFGDLKDRALDDLNESIAKVAESIAELQVP